MSGWFRIQREIFNSDIWHDVTTFRLFIYLIGQASHTDGLPHKGMILNKGQFVRSYRKLADDLSYKEGRGYKKYSVSTIKQCVNKLIQAERVNVNETEYGTLFTIVNYALYQGLGDREAESPNGLNEEVRTKSERSPNEVRTKSEQEQELKNLRIKELKDIYTHWNSKGIIRHREFTEKMKSHISARLATYSYEELIQAIDNYKKILDGDEFFYKHEFTLTDFMNPKNLDRFLTENKPFEKLRKFEKGERNDAILKGRTEEDDFLDSLSL